MGSPERVKREKAERRKSRETLILAEAEKLFLEKGFLSTKIGEIASACELTNGAIYLYYKNKDHLVMKVMTGISLRFGGFLEKEMQNNKDLSGWLQLENLLGIYNYTYENYRNYHLLDAQFNMMFNESYPDTPLLDEYFTANKRVLEIFTKVINRGVNDGSITAPLSTKRTAGMLLNAVNAYVEKISLRKELMEKEQGLSLEDELREYLEYIARGLRSLTE